MTKINFLIFLHEGPFLDEGGPEKQPIYLYWPYTITIQRQHSTTLCSPWMAESLSHSLTCSDIRHVLLLSTVIIHLV